MWADTLLDVERAHLFTLIIWAAASVLAGTALLVWLRRRPSSTLLSSFALHTAVWGAVELAVGALSYRGLAPRDLAAATRLDRLLWLNTGLAAGCAITGLAVATVGWKLGRRLGVVGAGVAVVVQGFALVLLELTLASQISR